MGFKQFAQVLLLMFLLSTLFIACNSEEPATRDISPLGVSPLTSTLPTPESESALRRGPDFYIDPLAAGDTSVSGTGPANIKINIVDVSWGGNVIGTGPIGLDGKFIIDVPPIEGGNRIGIMLADLNESGLKYEDFQNNEHYQDLPMVGLLVYYLDVPTE